MLAIFGVIALRLNRSALLSVVLSLFMASNSFLFADEREKLFETTVRPVLVEVCLRCHGNTKASGLLRVDSREALLKGGESGPAIVPGKPDEGLLIKAIQRQADVSAMPPEKEKALRPDQVAAFVSWVKAGAVWPATATKFEARQHWAFEPLRASVPTANPTASRSTVDALIHAKQSTAGASFVPQADKLTLIRRATFDLTGLPPTPDEIASFENDSSPQAFERVVDRLLQSRAYGERWGRHWLDVVRYADTAGETADYPVPLAWRYRNYVIDAFNNDKPYDQFLREQIAGDVLAQQQPSSPARYAEQVTATGYLAISRRFGFDSENYHHLTLQDTIDTLGQSVLGLSLGCARCHDHKFDPVSMRDYYALYGIFESTRYSFPGSEQKQKFRAMAPLVPLSESRQRWREYEVEVGSLTNLLEQQKQPLANVVLRSLHELDGDFELQAPAAGGSNGVLVPPWLYQGQIAVTTNAQSPFKNVHPRGRVGASVPAGNRYYRMAQALHPRRSVADVEKLFVNLDFRISPGDASARHRLVIGNSDAFVTTTTALEVLIGPEGLSFRSGEKESARVAIKSNQWQNLQLTLDLKQRTATGRVGQPGEVAAIAAVPLNAAWNGIVSGFVLDAETAATTASRPQIEYDNFELSEHEFHPVATTTAEAARSKSGTTDPAQIQKELGELAGIDGDFELQTKDAPPASPWNPGPNSVVKVVAQAQSPFRNIYPAGELGIQMPNRGEYDGFGLTFSPPKTDAEGRLFVSFDFRCAHQNAGGNGSWRYYIGHGPGSSAAVELFFNGQHFFRRSGNMKDAVTTLTIGEWYQVQMSLDLKRKTYAGTLSSKNTQQSFSGDLATGWDGALDYSFIDSYGHIGGVRPALDADNFSIRDTAFSALDAAPNQAIVSTSERRAKVALLRQQLAGQQGQLDWSKQRLNQLLVDGPFAMTYGMSEGTPHDARLQKRGEPDQLGDVVPRGFIQVLGGGPLPNEATGSGRLELAHWLTGTCKPLVARVMVNRIWQYHFGRGLVVTPNDFGLRGQPPTHPELLDHLANEFIRSGWSIKTMHRRIMNSDAYQQASRDSGATGSSSLYASFTRRRLSAEEIRDSILLVSGTLDATPGEGHPFPMPTTWGYSQHGPFSAVYDHDKRSVYLMTQRLKRHPFLALFDGADPNTSTPDRLGTTVPTQALFFLNDAFVHTKADAWSAQLQAQASEDKARIELAWQRAIGRPPRATELSDAIEFLTAYRAELAASKSDQIEARTLAAYLRSLLGSNEFLHVD